jgi:hypothetical protein
MPEIDLKNKMREYALSKGYSEDNVREVEETIKGWNYRVYTIIGLMLFSFIIFLVGWFIWIKFLN